MRPSLLVLSSALVANAYIVNFFEGSAKKCLDVGAVCKTNGGVVGPCCKNSHCPEPIVDISRCTLNVIDTEAEDDDDLSMAKKCLKPGALCASIAGPMGKCCRRSKCVYRSPDNAICEKTNKVTIEIDLGDVSTDAKCLNAGATCSGIAGPTGKCCSGLRCVNESPDRGICRGPKKLDIFQEEDETTNAKCLSAGATCSGFAGPTGRCCSGLRCVNESPDLSVCRGPKKSALVVQDSVFTQAKCLKAGAGCAGIAGPTGTCCAPLKCVYNSPDHATCRGIRKSDEYDEEVDAGGACIKNGATCASANGRFQPCCAGWECVRDNPYEPEHGACYRKKN